MDGPGQVDLALTGFNATYVNKADPVFRLGDFRGNRLYGGHNSGVQAVWQDNMLVLTAEIHISLHGGSGSEDDGISAGNGLVDPFVLLRQFHAEGRLVDPVDDRQAESACRT